MLVTDATTGQSVAASFLAADTTGTNISIMATTISGTPLGHCNACWPPANGPGAWNFSVTGNGYTAGNPAYLSFGVGAGYSRNNLEVWNYNGSQWTNYAPSDLTYDGTYASFTVRLQRLRCDRGPVPEPGTLVLFAMGLFSLLAYAWRRRRV